MHELSIGAEAVLARNLAASKASTTRKAYDRAWSAFVAFAGSSRIPADPYQVALYLSHLGEQAKPSTVRQHAAAISAMHREAGHDTPVQHAGVVLAMKGNARRQGVAPEQSDGLDAARWEQITEHATDPRITRGGRLENEAEAGRRALQDMALISTMRDAMLRRSEAAALTWEDIRFEADGTGRVLIRKSKTDQEGQGAIKFLSDVTVELLVAIRIVRDPEPEDSVFRLSASQICRRIAQAATQAGLIGHFSGHSPRIGMAVDLARSGYSLPAIQEAGRWQSPDMPAYYIRSVSAAQGAVADWHRSRTLQ